MKMLATRIVIVTLAVTHFSFAQPLFEAGADAERPMSVEFRSRNSLIIVHALINDTLRVNLALDPHCRSVILFGKKYSRLLEASLAIGRLHSFKDEAGPPVFPHNKLSIGPVVGENVPIVVLPNANPMNFFASVNGVMGTEFFAGFGISIDAKKEIITFIPGVKNNEPLVFVKSQKSAFDLLNFH
jgi:hypothetical protein